MRGARALAAAVAVAFPAALFVGAEPGRHDLPSRARTGLEAPDDGYWTAPARRLAGAGTTDRFDHDLALALAGPQNAVAAAATAVGVPHRDARFLGSALGAAVLAGLAVLGLAGRARGAGAVLLAVLWTPPVLGHLVADLGEGTALALTALWAVAALRGRFGLAAFVAAVGLSQKACGLALGVGTLVGVLAEPGRRGPRVLAAGVGALLGVVATAAGAALVFGDDPLQFVLRPWRATGETGAGASGLAVLVQAAFVGHHGVGVELLPAFLAAVVVGTWAGPRRPMWALEPLRRFTAASIRSPRTALAVGKPPAPRP